jgi:hypothetical protein
MNIEIIVPNGSPNTDKGDLLEKLAEQMLQIQGYKVTNKIRVTASELDLLCKHEVSGKTIYVECKAHNDNLPASVLKNLLGTIDFKDYSEGWLISTGPLGKDAKGFVVEWESKPPAQRERLSIYNPENVIFTLKNAHLLSDPPELPAKEILGTELSKGEWTLLISPWGRYWICPTLMDGIPKGVLLFNAQDGRHIQSIELLEKIKNSDTSFKDLNFTIQTNEEKKVTKDSLPSSSAVVEVEYGERWTDYRPSRPEHFVGRAKSRRSLLSFFTNVKKRKTETRVFAIKGDSGIGKSSLIAKIRDVANTSKKPNKLFLYAVDVRAASDSSYISSSLLAALRSASRKGFGLNETLEVSNYTDPIQSKSIRSFLAECERKHELIIIVFDQFEELYSKAGLFPIFEEAKKLMFSTIAASTNLVLGFAWKTDSTVPQDHPAYHMWHELKDHRREVSLTLFSHADAENSIRLFESELSEKVRSDLRKYLLESSQGYPWLLKKLCIHLYEQIQTGTSQYQLVDTALDINSLFDRDLSNLTDSETVCLKFVAQNAPTDWYEVLETTDHEVVQSLQNKRLLIRRGDKLNLYWDIFRDYVLNRIIPTIPFTYIPQSPSIEALLRVSLQLDTTEAKSNLELSKIAEFEESTVRNISHDLEQFGISVIEGGRVKLDSHIRELSTQSILTRIRFVFKRHGLINLLKENNTSNKATHSQIVQYLKKLNPTAQHRGSTWEFYASRMVSWIYVLGYINRFSDGVLYDDKGDIIENEVKKFRGEKRRILFIGDAPPARVYEALEFLKTHNNMSFAYMKSQGFRNACAVLFRFQLINLTSTHYYQINEEILNKYSTSLEAIWTKAFEEDSLKYVINYLNDNPTASHMEIGKYIAKQFDRPWTDDTCRVTGGSLYRWASWIMSKGDDGIIPKPPGSNDKPNSEPQLF